MKTPAHNSCTILRTFVRSHGLLSLRDGSVTPTYRETVTEPCGAPLFGTTERNTGVCRSCARGWTHEDNQFASDAERARAAS